jgi:hypothetical protein
LELPNQPNLSPEASNLQHRLNGESAVRLLGFFIGLAYASGFIVVSTYLGRLGAREASHDLVRLKYIHVGVLSLLVPGFVLPAIYFLGKVLQRLVKARQNTISNRLFTGGAEIVGGIVGVLMAINLCGLLEFSSFAVYRNNSVTVLAFWSCVLTLLGLVLKYRDFATTPFWATAVRWLVSAAALFFGTDIFLACRFERLYTSSATPICTYVVIVLVTAAYFLIMLRANSADAKRGGVFGLRLAFFVGLYYLSLLAFANLVYPIIPAERGGGDLSQVKPVRLCADFDAMLPPTLVAANSPQVLQPHSVEASGKKTYVESACTVPVKVIEQNPESLIVMNAQDSRVFVIRARVNLEGEPVAAEQSTGATEWPFTRGGLRVLLLVELIAGLFVAASVDGLTPRRELWR